MRHAGNYSALDLPPLSCRENRDCVVADTALILGGPVDWLVQMRTKTLQVLQEQALPYCRLPELWTRHL